MKKINLTIETDVLHYEHPVPVRKKLLKKNEFCKVILPGREAIYLSTLSDFHHTNAAEIKRCLEIFFDQESLSFHDIDFQKRFFNLIKDHQVYKLHGELLFHIETVLFFLIQQERPDLFLNLPLVKENALFNEANALETYASYPCVKIKITPVMPHEKLTTILTSLHQQQPHQLFRLDGNRKFELQDFLHLIRKIPAKLFPFVDYVEEPFKSFHEVHIAHKITGLKFAIDESFQIYFEQQHLNLIKAETPIVLKPSLFGISTALQLMNSRPNNRFIVSSSFEHPKLKPLYTFMAGARPLEIHGLSMASVLINK